MLAPLLYTQSYPQYSTQLSTVRGTATEDSILLCRPHRPRCNTYTYTREYMGTQCKYNMQIHKYHNTYIIEWADGSYTVVSEDSVDDSWSELVDILDTLRESEQP